MARYGTITQPDLFEEPRPGMRLTAAERAKAVEQLQALLMEAMAGLAGWLEADDDQDHA